MKKEGLKELAAELCAMISKMKRYQRLAANNRIEFEINDDDLSVKISPGTQKRIIRLLDRINAIEVIRRNSDSSFHVIELQEKLDTVYDELRSDYPLIFNLETGDVILRGENIGVIPVGKPQYHLFDALYYAFKKDRNLVVSYEVLLKFYMKKKQYDKYGQSAGHFANRYKSKLPLAIKNLIIGGFDTYNQPGYRINVI